MKKWEEGDAVGGIFMDKPDGFVADYAVIVAVRWFGTEVHHMLYIGTLRADETRGRGRAGPL